LGRAGCPQEQYSEYIRHRYQITGSLAPGCDARDLRAWLEQNGNGAAAPVATVTEVRDLAGGPTQAYTLPPASAVVAAYEQARGNWNTWEYQADHPELLFGPSCRTVFCGQFAATLEVPCPTM